MSNRERAWTAEQVEAIAEDMLASGSGSAFRMLNVYAATLRQQAEQAGGVVSDDLRERCREVLEWQSTGILRDGALRAEATRMDDADDMALPRAEEKTKREAMQAIASGAPLLRAPADGNGMVDEPIGHPRSGTDTRDEIELFLRDAFAAGCHAAQSRSLLLAITYAHREAPKLRAALMQNAQGEAVFQYRHVVDKTWRDCDEVDADAYGQTGCHEVRKLYLHAERARVPENEK